tara:strand:+ start:2454 stop:3197 length:744 start_codon:yes stop_codon:yes gene_type:complete
MSNNVSKFISKLDKFSEQSIEVFLPSKKKTITVSPLNLKQQKDLMASMLDGVKGTLDFSRTLNNIILDNSKIANLKIFDKIPITVGMRIEALGAKYTDSAGRQVDLQAVLDAVKKTKLQLKEEKLIEYKNLKINLAIPALEDENSLLRKSSADLEPKADNFRQEVSVLYLLEIAKYIKKLEIDGVAIDLSDVKVSDRIHLVEKLPLAIYTDISDYIEAVNTYNTDLLTVGDIKVSIDSYFFDSESTE